MSTELEGRGALAPDLFYWTGRALFAVQVAERAMKRALKHAGNGAIATWERVAADDAVNRTAPLGRLLKKLRERVQIGSEFDEALSQFLCNRNEFVHHFQTRFRLRTPEETAEAIVFLKQLDKTAGVVITVLLEATRGWSKDLLGDQADALPQTRLGGLVAPTIEHHLSRKPR